MFSGASCLKYKTNHLSIETIDYLRLPKITRYNDKMKKEESEALFALREWLDWIRSTVFVRQADRQTDRQTDR